MKVLIIEDERAAVRSLKNILSQVDASIEVVDVLEGIADTVEWFGNNPMPDRHASASSNPTWIVTTSSTGMSNDRNRTSWSCSRRSPVTHSLSSCPKRPGGTAASRPGKKKAPPEQECRFRDNTRETARQCRN